MNEFENKVFEEINHIKYSLEFYIKENKRLENELKYYKNAYENRVNETLKIKIH